MRTRPAYTEAELRDVYAQPWEMDAKWSDHDLRRAATVELMQGLDTIRVAGDLSCGDAYFAPFIDAEWHLGDFAGGYRYQGPIEQTLYEIPHVDLFMLCETLEHIDNPDLLLSQLRWRADRLILTTPLMTQFDENPQHYWAWDDEAIRAMVEEAEWEVETYARTYPDVGYVFQCWSLK